MLCSVLRSAGPEGAGDLHPRLTGHTAQMAMCPSAPLEMTQAWGSLGSLLLGSQAGLDISSYFLCRCLVGCPPSPCKFQESTSQAGMGPSASLVGEMWGGGEPPTPPPLPTRTPSPSSPLPQVESPCAPLGAGLGPGRGHEAALGPRGTLRPVVCHLIL